MCAGNRVCFMFTHIYIYKFVLLLLAFLLWLSLFSLQVFLWPDQPIQRQERMERASLTLYSPPKKVPPLRVHTSHPRSHSKPTILRDNIHDKICWKVASISNFKNANYLNSEFQKMYIKQSITSQVCWIKKKLNVNLLHYRTKCKNNFIFCLI